MKEISSSEAVELLRQLVRIPSPSGEEAEVAGLLIGTLMDRGAEVHSKGNNLWVFNRFYDPEKPTILLNSHIDTVKPNIAYIRDPYDSTVESGKIYGLGTTDAGASVVSLTAAFSAFHDSANLTHNLCLALTAEEERSGAGGIESILDDLGAVSFAIVGEPTGMDMAVAEKGLLVLDGLAKGIAGHAARCEGDNAIYRAMEDIQWFRDYRFEKISETLGEVHMSVTMIQAGTQHNVVPAECRFTVDVRVTDAYSLEEVIQIVEHHVRSEITPRSVRLRPSGIPSDHPVVMAGRSLGMKTFGSPTLSDQALIPVPSVKLGPGDSRRSHSADEYVLASELSEGIEKYKELLAVICHLPPTEKQFQ